MPQTQVLAKEGGADSERVFLCDGLISLPAHHSVKTHQGPNHAHAHAHAPCVLALEPLVCLGRRAPSVSWP